MGKRMIHYNKPTIIGLAVLDLSKLIMYDFHYNTIQRKYGSAARLLFTDTDSLTYHITTPDFYADMAEMAEQLDTSDYPKAHPLHSDRNKKVIGKFKDETNGTPIKSFVGLRAKMYSIHVPGAKKEHKCTAKGVKRSAIAQLTHDDYKRAIFGTSEEELRQKATFCLIRSTNHTLATLRVTKTSLCAYDDKRWVCDDNVTTLAHGHKDTLARL